MIDGEGNAGAKTEGDVVTLPASGKPSSKITMTKRIREGSEVQGLSELDAQIVAHKVNKAKALAKRYPGITYSVKGNSVDLNFHPDITIPEQELVDFRAQITPDDL